ncbi:MAG: hypothetical protein HYZ53_30865 [Planctomycetes bacterium]|nr:hypothetical protein [Planctomycetota bacterium]
MGRPSCRRDASFEVAAGGFDWFGQPAGKPLLTAYGLLELADMAKVHDVDRAHLERTARWLEQQQSADGSFPVDGCPHAWRQGADGPVVATAYVAWSLLEAGFRGRASERAIAYLRAHAEEQEDAYALALLANAFVAYHRDQDYTLRALERLVRAARRDGERVGWDTSMSGIAGAVGGAASTEATCLAAYALLRAAREPELVDGALATITRAKDLNGAWGSTQATILAIKTLLAAAEGGAGGVRGRVAVRVSLNGEAAGELVFEEGKTDFLQQLSFNGRASAGKNVVRMEPDGKSTLSWQLCGRAYVPKCPTDAVSTAAAATPSSPLALSVKFDRTAVAADDRVRADVSVRYLDERPTFMVIVDLGIPPGFEPEAGDFEELVQRRTIERFTLTGRQITIYLGALSKDSPIDFSYRLQAKLPVRAAVPAASAYEYYAPDRRADAADLPAILEAR